MEHLGVLPFYPESLRFPKVVNFPLIQSCCISIFHKFAECRRIHKRKPFLYLRVCELFFTIHGHNLTFDSTCHLLDTRWSFIRIFPLLRGVFVASPLRCFTAGGERCPSRSLTFCPQSKKKNDIQTTTPINRDYFCKTTFFHALSLPCDL